MECNWQPLNFPRRTCQPPSMAKRKGHFIREWRKHRGLTQEQLAERIGITREYVSLIEKGKRRYDQPFLESAADALTCSPADLIIRDPSSPEAIWSIWDNIRPQDRERAVRLLEVLVEKKTGTDG
jgi:transcriptional regulator with XRE-family HTH domain